MDSGEINRIRGEINLLDKTILDLLSRRAAAALEIGRHKQALGLPILDPDREEQIISRLAALNQGPLPAEAVRRIFAEIMSGCREIQYLRVA